MNQSSLQKLKSDLYLVQGHWKEGLPHCQIHFSQPQTCGLWFSMILALFSCYYGVMQNTKKTWELTVGPTPHMEPTKKSKNPWREYFHPEIFISIQKNSRKKNPGNSDLSDPFFWGCLISDPEIKGCCWWPPTGRCFNNSRDSQDSSWCFFSQLFWKGSSNQPTQAAHFINYQPKQSRHYDFLGKSLQNYPTNLHQELDPQKNRLHFHDPNTSLQKHNQLHP